MQSQSARKRFRISDLVVSLYDEERTYAGYLMRKLGIKGFNSEVLSHGINDDDISSDALSDEEAEDRVKKVQEINVLFDLNIRALCN